MSTTTETVAELRSRQTVWPDWMATATAGLADDDLVDVDRKVTPFGRFVLAVRPAAQTALGTS